jgi:hypothetical protein
MVVILLPHRGHLRPLRSSYSRGILQFLQWKLASYPQLCRSIDQGYLACAYKGIPGNLQPGVPRRLVPPVSRATGRLYTREAHAP